jgi:hypothetical protein
MQEIDVIRATRRFLQQHGLLRASVLDLFTDAHPTLLGAVDLRPFQRFTLAFDGFATHPEKGYNPDTDLWELATEARN